jgi:transcriptional regulator with XRE-family HTH domain
MEDTILYAPTQHMGRKIERVRKLIGKNQTELGEVLGITKQAVSKMEQSEKIADERLKEVAVALGVTEEGLKRFDEGSALYYTYNFYENCGVNSASIGANNIDTINNFPIEKTMEFFEKLLQVQQKKHEKEGKEK